MGSADDDIDSGWDDDEPVAPKPTPAAKAEPVVASKPIATSSVEPASITTKSAPLSVKPAAPSVKPAALSVKPAALSVKPAAPSAKPAALSAKPAPASVRPTPNVAPTPKPPSASLNQRPVAPSVPPASVPAVSAAPRPSSTAPRPSSMTSTPPPVSVRPLTATHAQATEAKSDRTPSTVPSALVNPAAESSPIQSAGSIASAPPEAPPPPSSRREVPEAASVSAPGVAAPAVAATSAAPERIAPIDLPATNVGPSAAAFTPVAAAPISVRSPDSGPSSGRGLALDNETLRPAEVDPPIVIQRRRSGSKVIAPAVITAALIVTSVSWIRLSADAGHTSAPQAEAPSKHPAAAAPAANQAPKQPEPAAPVPAEPASATTSPATTTPSAQSPELAGAFAAALNKTPTSSLVSVRTVPPAIIFESGKRVGSGTIEVNVEPTIKKRFTALLDGHAPQNFTIDGSRPAVTIMMKPVGKSTASFPPVGGKPTGESGAPKSGQAPPTAEFSDPINDVAQ
jgi:hypothetical protein